MKIVHVIDYFQPKLGYQETFLAREHAALGHDVCVVTSDRYNRGLYIGDTATSVLGQRIQKAGFFTEEGMKVWRLKTVFELPNIIWVSGLEKKIRELKPDLVIMHGITNLLAVRIARLKRAITDVQLKCVSTHAPRKRPAARKMKKTEMA